MHRELTNDNTVVYVPIFQLKDIIIYYYYDLGHFCARNIYDFLKVGF